MIVKTLYQYGQMSFLCTVHRNLCIVHRILCTFHRQFWQILCKMWNFHLEPRTKILTHFKVSDGEIAFLKFHFLLEVIIHNFHIIISRREWNFKKSDFGIWALEMCKNFDSWFQMKIQTHLPILSALQGQF